MADLTSSGTIRRLNPNNELVEIEFNTGSPITLTGGTDTIRLMPASYGIKNVLGVTEYTHTVDGAVIIMGGSAAAGSWVAPATYLSGGSFVITTSAGYNNARRVYRIFGTPVSE